jgi:eukaryotic-like serine/threonine-protein kinase
MTESDPLSLFEKIYREALQVQPAERQSFLDQACNGDANVRREVESRLAKHHAETQHDSSDGHSQSVAPNPPLNLIGLTLDNRYYVEQRLSRGGMGDLYLARDKPEVMSRRVVVKVLQETALEDDWIITKFRQEIEALTRIDDPGVVGLLDAGTLPNGHPYLVMQFVEGSNLRSLMRPDRGMEFEDVGQIWQLVGRTLTAAHERDVVHRDLKPENIMVRRRPDGSWQVKVIDFGIAKIRNSLVAPSTVTARVAGTANYMAPEQLEGKRASVASDVYSLGVIAYEMLTGRRPFNPETAFQLSNLQKSVPLSPRVLRPGVPFAAETALLKALSYRPSDRYDKARDFGDELARALLDTDDGFGGQVQPIAGGDISHGASTTPNTPVNPAFMATVRSEAPSPGDDTKDRSAPTLVSLIEPRLPSLGENHPLTAVQGKTGWPRWVPIFSLMLLMTIAGFIALKLWWKPAGSERSLTYWLSVQRTFDNKALGQPFDATGREYFHTGDRFILNVLTSEAGALYLINEGQDEKGMPEWNVLFPTRDNNRGQPALVAGQNVKTGWYRFAGSTGVERVWLVWTVKQDSLLDAIVRDAQGDGVIHDSSQQTQLRDFFKTHASSATELIQDESTARAMIKGRGEIIVRRLDFSHKPNS